MSVDIDKSGRNDSPSGFEDFRGIRRCDARLQSGDPSASDGDIHDAVEPLARVQYPSSLDHEVELGSFHQTAKREGGGGAGSGVKEAAAIER